MAEFTGVQTGMSHAANPRAVVLANKGSYVVPAVVPGDTDTIKIATLPKGAIPLGGVLLADGGNTSLTITVGDGTTADKYGTVTDATAAFEHQMTGLAGGELAADTDIILTLGAADTVEDDVYTCVVWYYMAQ